MAEINRSLLQELGAAAQGTVALLSGQRSAPAHFDFSRRGLVGSFIAFIVSNTLVAYGPQLLGMPVEAGSASRAMFLSIIVYLMEQGVAYLVLNQLKRQDGFVPYLVADNWTTLFTSALLLLMLLLGGGSAVPLIVIVIVGMILKVNIARLVVTLSPGQVVMFIVAQLLGTGLGVLALNSLFPGAGILPV